MAHIVLTAEQLRILEQTLTAVELRDEAGRRLGQIPAPSEEEIVARLKRERASEIPRYPAHVVESRLRRLEEIREQEGMDEAKMRDLLQRMRAGEQV